MRENSKLDYGHITLLAQYLSATPDLSLNETHLGCFPLANPNNVNYRNSNCLLCLPLGTSHQPDTNLTRLQYRLAALSPRLNDIIGLFASDVAREGKLNVVFSSAGSTFRVAL